MTERSGHKYLVVAALAGFLLSTLVLGPFVYFMQQKIIQKDENFRLKIDSQESRVEKKVDSLLLKK